MPKTKKIYTTCPLCQNKTITIEVKEDLAENQEYYPFEYLNIHGDPPHALMLFLDRNLSVRDSMPYDDIDIAKAQKKEFSSMVRMSEVDTLASIYNEPLRLKILKLLTKGGVTENEIIEFLSKQPKFDPQQFNVLILPFIKAELVETSWLQVSRYQCYYLVKDFIALKVPSKLTEKAFKEDSKFRRSYDSYIKKREEIFKNYKSRFFSNEMSRIIEIQICFNILTNYEYEKIIRRIRFGPIKKEELLKDAKKEDIQDLIEKKIIWDFEVKGTNYCALLCDIVIKKFTPKYLLDIIPQKLKNEETSLEMAKTHLDFLYENEIK
jgi:hypothetical protein